MEMLLEWLVTEPQFKYIMVAMVAAAFLLAVCGLRRPASRISRERSGERS